MGIAVQRTEDASSAANARVWQRVDMAQVRSSTKATNACLISHVERLIETFAQSNSTEGSECCCRNGLEEMEIGKGGTNVNHGFLNTQIIRAFKFIVRRNGHFYEHRHTGR